MVVAPGTPAFAEATAVKARICPQYKFNTPWQFSSFDQPYTATRVMLTKICTMTAKSAPYPPCTVTAFWLKYQDPARMLHRVKQPPHIAGLLSVTWDNSIHNLLTDYFQIVNKYIEFINYE